MFASRHQPVCSRMASVKIFISLWWTMSRVSWQRETPAPHSKHWNPRKWQSIEMLHLFYVCCTHRSTNRLPSLCGFNTFPATNVPFVESAGLLKSQMQMITTKTFICFCVQDFLNRLLLKHWILCKTRVKQWRWMLSRQRNVLWIQGRILLKMKTSEKKKVIAGIL